MSLKEELETFREQLNSFPGTIGGPLDSEIQIRAGTILELLNPEMEEELIRETLYSLNHYMGLKWGRAREKCFLGMREFLNELETASPQKYKQIESYTPNLGNFVQEREKRSYERENQTDLFKPT